MFVALLTILKIVNLNGNKSQAL